MLVLLVADPRLASIRSSSSSSLMMRLCSAAPQQEEGFLSLHLSSLNPLLVYSVVYFVIYSVFVVVVFSVVVVYSVDLTQEVILADCR